jgi:diketogulonate reductase-like aldo/keto reductase
MARSGICAIAATRKADQAVQNAEAARMSLPEGDLAEMNDIRRMVTNYLGQKTGHAKL